MTRRSLTLILLSFVSLTLHGRALLAEETKVKPQQRVGELLQDRARPADAGNEALRDASGATGKLALWAGGLAVGSLALVILRRTGKRKLEARWGSEGIEVVGRTMLSPKHSVWLLKIGGKRMALGVSGDQMTSLGLWEEPVLVGGLAERERPRPEKTGGFTIRPQDREAISAARSHKESDLLPYRKQVERLRGLLRGLRSESPDDALGEDPRS